MSKATIVAYDFDGTVTKRDSFLLFILHAHGYFKTALGLLVISPIILAYFLKLVSNHWAKEKVFSFFFKGISKVKFDTLCDSFVLTINQKTNPVVLKKVQSDIQKGHTVLIISASIENWILPWSKQYKITAVCATQIEINENSKLTGRFASPNCYGPEKVNRLLQVYPHRSNYILIAHGNSSGDKELLALADKEYFYH